MTVSDSHITSLAGERENKPSAGSGRSWGATNDEPHIQSYSWVIQHQLTSFHLLFNSVRKGDFLSPQQRSSSTPRLWNTLSDCRKQFSPCKRCSHRWNVKWQQPKNLFHVTLAGPALFPVHQLPFCCLNPPPPLSPTALHLHLSLVCIGRLWSHLPVVCLSLCCCNVFTKYVLISIDPICHLRLLGANARHSWEKQPLILNWM